MRLLNCKRDVDDVGGPCCVSHGYGNVGRSTRHCIVDGFGGVAASTESRHREEAECEGENVQEVLSAKRLTLRCQEAEHEGRWDSKVGRDGCVAMAVCRRER